MVNDTTQNLNGQRFLIAEDEVIIAMLFEDVIERCGGTVVPIGDSRQRLAARGRVDVPHR